MKKITYDEFVKFRKEWYAEPRGLRFGQAFYNRFHGYKGVEEADHDHNLFYDTNVIRVENVITTNLIDFGDN